MDSILRCIKCGKEYDINRIRYFCECGSLLDVIHDVKDVSLDTFEKRIGKGFPYNSGIWRYKELVLPVENKFIVSKPEGNTNLYVSSQVAEYCGLENLGLKHEGENPTGSFKDRGMTSGVTAARFLGAKTVACASTGNTSASMASYADTGGLKAVVFIPEGKIAYGKLSQALAYGAETMQIRGNFDDAMALVQEVSAELGLYLLNSVNPFRLEGQKTIMFETLQQMSWEIPDWIVVPGGNLGNSSSFGKAFHELKQLGLIDKMPRIAIIQAHGSNPLYRSFKNGFKKYEPVKDPETIATAIKIGNPVNYDKAVRAINWTNGTVEEVTEQEIMDAKAVVDGSGVGAEPASCASVAGAKKLVEKGVIKEDENIVCILTGNLLKDPDATVNYHMNKISGIKPAYPNKPTVIDSNLAAVKQNLR